jgi:hypothetical protein
MTRQNWSFGLFELIICTCLLGMELYFWFASSIAPSPVTTFLLYSVPNIVVFALLIWKHPRLNIIACLLVGAVLSASLERYVNAIFRGSKSDGVNILLGLVLIAWIPCVSLCLSLTYFACKLFQRVISHDDRTE